MIHSKELIKSRNQEMFSKVGLIGDRRALETYEIIVSQVRINFACDHAIGMSKKSSDCLPKFFKIELKSNVVI